MRLVPLLVLVATCSPPGEQPNADRGTSRPNVLLVVLDDVGWADVDGIPTPAMDALAAQGVTFRKAWSNPVCSSTRYTLHFGRYSGRAGIGRSISHRGHRSGDAWDPDAADDVSLAELLGRNGYSTALFGKWHLPVDEKTGCGRPRDQGYDTERAVSIGNLVSRTGNGSYFEWERVDDGKTSVETEYATRAQTNAFVEWVRRAPEPWFAFLGYSAAHTPHHAPPPELLPADYEVGDTPRERYEAMVMALDTAIGEALSAVSLEKTLVLLVSDNGTAEPSLREGWTSGRFKGSTYEGGINVPLIAAGHTVSARGVSEALVGTVDVMATIADVAGIEPPPGVDSKSFAPCLADPGASGKRFLYSEYFAPNGDAPKTVYLTAARSARYKLLSGGEREQFFDLLSDPDELRSLDLDALSSEEGAAIAKLRRFVAAREDPSRKVLRPGDSREGVVDVDPED